MENTYCKLLLSMVFSSQVQALTQFLFGLCCSDELKGIHTIKKEKAKHLLSHLLIFFYN